MSYLVLARKYRSRNFAEVVGQEHVVRALSHALEQKRLHHAWLFTGTRGVGKTTLSRILAKALNCVGADGQGDITPEPCNVCEACRAIDAGRFVDYVEMDAASNRGVEEMTALLERSVYAPTAARFKVFMIDEVHMLSNHAFNAMLKTLEEPPAHLKFILATTDPQKVPVTVLSRCLQFNLKQMPPGHIVEHLGNVLRAERIDYEPNALRLLAQSAHGSMRDALSLTDQAIAYSAGPVGEAVVRAMLGAIDTGYLVRIGEALLAEDGAALMAIAGEMAERSVGYGGALQELALLFQRIAIARTVPAALPDDLPEVDDIRRLATAFDAQEAQLHYDIAIRGRRDLPLAPDERAGFEMTLLRMLAFRPARLGEPAAAGPAPADAGKALAALKASVGVAPRAAAAPVAARPAVPPAAPLVAPAPAVTTVARVEAPVPVAPTAPPVEAAPAAVTPPADAGIPFDPPYVERVPAADAAPRVAEPPPRVAAIATPTASPVAASPVARPAADAASARPSSANARAALDLLKGRGSNAAPRCPAPVPVAAAVEPTASASAAERQSLPPAPAATAQPQPAPAPQPSLASARAGAAQPSPVRAAQPTPAAAPRPAAPPAADDDGPPPFDDDDPGYDDYADPGGPEPEFMPDFAPADYADGPDAGPRPARRAGNGADHGASADDRRSGPSARATRAPAPAIAPLVAIDDWPSYAASLDLKGLPRELARQTELIHMEGDTLRLRIENPALAEPAIVARLVAALRERSGQTLKLNIEAGTVTDSAGIRRLVADAERQREAEDGFLADPFVKTLLEHGASIVPGSIKPLEESK
ncbi:DNA polymerase III subunit gamma/tau [Derxia lacustris]|uniref:DNA polymerase III subunit gamma/tau n=1 Tax=Derxia lacustris TaxID=764842 RepID=UPI000A174720|nr:DNA polymerase III subunit gamma/tau [Derxia lacustris]